MFSLFSDRRKSKGKGSEQLNTKEDKQNFETISMPSLKAQKTIRILLLPIGEPPVVCTIEAHENTYDFKNSFDMLVNGSVELTYVCRDNGCFILLGTNNVGKLIGLAPNRFIFDGHDVLVGQGFIIAKLENGTYCDLTDEQISRYKKQFAKIIDTKEEQIVKELLEKHAGIRIKDVDGKTIHNLKMEDMRSILAGHENVSN